MKNELLTLLERGLKPLVQLNAGIRDRLDWDGYLSPGMVAQVVQFGPAPGWECGMSRIVLEHGPFSEWNAKMEDSAAQNALADGYCTTQEELLLLDGTSLDFMTVLNGCDMHQVSLGRH